MERSGDIQANTANTLLLQEGGSPFDFRERSGKHLLFWPVAVGHNQLPLLLDDPLFQLVRGSAYRQHTTPGALSCFSQQSATFAGQLPKCLCRIATGGREGYKFSVAVAGPGGYCKPEPLMQDTPGAPTQGPQSRLGPVGST
jgi:hypothetical protein